VGGEISPTLLEILRDTLSKLERELNLSAEDPGLREFKLALVRAIGELELKRAAGTPILDESGPR
jgi:hypothetical protein